MPTWMEQCGLSFQEVERCLELADMMESCSGFERQLIEARLLGMIEGLGFGWRRAISGIVHVCEIANIPWKRSENGRVLWGDDALDKNDPRRDNGKQAVRRNLCETATDLAGLMREIKDNERIDHDLVMGLREKARKERENRRRYPFK